MANFLSDIFDAVSGQQASPQQTIIPTDQLLNQSYGMLNSTVAPGLVGFNQALAPGLTDVQLGVTNQIDPSILANYRGANQSILDQLNLGSNLGADLQNQVITNALQGSAASGFGVSNGGRGLVARDLGLTGLDLLRKRQQDSLAAGTTGLGVSNRIYNPAQYTQLGAGLAEGVAANIDQEQAARDQYANLVEDTRRKNFASLMNTGGKILGSVAGAATGIPGASGIGGAIGGSFIQGSGVAGMGMRTPSSNQFSSILSIFNRIGGPQWGIGARRGPDNPDLKQLSGFGGKPEYQDFSGDINSGSILPFGELG